MLNRKGDIPTLILFVGALALIALGIFVQLSFEINVGSSERDYSSFREEVIFRERLIERSLEMMIDESMMGDWNEDSFRDKIRGEGEKRRAEYGTNLFLKVISEDYDIIEKDGKRYLEMNEVFIKFDLRENEYSRTFNITKEIGKIS